MYRIATVQAKEIIYHLNVVTFLAQPHQPTPTIIKIICICILQHSFLRLCDRNL